MSEKKWNSNKQQNVNENTYIYGDFLRLFT